MIIEDNTSAELIRRWVEQLVVGLNLCPFAAQPLRQGRVRIVVSDAANPEVLLTDLLEEAFRLGNAPVEDLSTTLLVIPRCLPEFADFNDFHGLAEEVMAEMGLEGELQLASFHPDYCFADSTPDDPANYSNRAPLPVLHLLREAELERVLAHHPDPSQIYQQNIRQLRELGTTRLTALLAGCAATE